MQYVVEPATASLSYGVITEGCAEGYDPSRTGVAERSDDALVSANDCSRRAPPPSAGVDRRRRAAATRAGTGRRPHAGHAAGCALRSRVLVADRAALRAGRLLSVQFRIDRQPPVERRHGLD